MYSKFDNLDVKYQPTIQRILIDIENNRDYFTERVREVFLEVRNSSKLVFVARQSLPLMYLLKGYYESLDIPFPEVGVVSFNKIGNSYEISEDTRGELISSLGGEITIIDDTSSTGETMRSINRITRNLRNDSNYKFIYFGDELANMPWDIERGDQSLPLYEYLSFAEIMEKNKSEGLLLLQKKLLKGVKSDNPVSNQISRIINDKMYTIGKEAREQEEVNS